MEDPVDKLCISVAVKGVYALPETWKVVDTDGLDFEYRLEVAKVELAAGKLDKRQLSESEIQVAEESKRPKGKKITPDEQEALDRARQAREEAEQRRQNQLSQLDEATRFHVLSEDITVGARVTWEANSGSVELVDVALVVFEETFVDEGGLWVTFTKKPILTEDEAKKKYKGKGAPEPLVLTTGRGFLDLNALRKPGITLAEQRVSFEDTSDTPVFQQRTYVQLSISITPAVTPIPKPRPSPQSIVPPLPPIPKYIPSKNATEDFFRQARLACKALAHEYYKTFEFEEDPMTPEFKERRKEHFLYNLNMSGKGNVLKYKLKKSVVRVVKELYPNLASVKGLSFSKQDRLYTDVYGTLNDNANLAVESVRSATTKLMKEELVPSVDFSVQEKARALERMTEETADHRLKRLYEENEFLGRTDAAKEIMKVRANTRDPAVWLDFGIFSLKADDLYQAEQCFKQIIAIKGSSANIEDLLLYSGILIQTRNLGPVKPLLFHAFDQDETDCRVTYMLMLMYEKEGKHLLSSKFYAITKRICLRHLRILQNRPGKEDTANSSLGSAYFRPLPENTDGPLEDLEDDACYFIVEFMMKYSLMELADSLLQRIHNPDNSLPRFLYYKSLIYYSRQQFAEGVEVLRRLLGIEPLNSEAWLLLGHVYWHQNEVVEAERAYFKALSSSSQPDVFLLIRLGQLALKREQWENAKRLLIQVANIKPYSFTMSGLGVACMQMKQYDEAERALAHANLLDDEEPQTWGYLCKVLLLQGGPNNYVKARQCLASALRLKLADTELLTEIGCMLLTNYYLESPTVSTPRLSVIDPLACFKAASSLLHASGLPINSLQSAITRTFEELKSRDDNRLDVHLQELLNDSEAEILSAI